MPTLGQSLRESTKESRLNIQKCVDCLQEWVKVTILAQNNPALNVYMWAWGIVNPILVVRKLKLLLDIHFY